VDEKGFEYILYVLEPLLIHDNRTKKKKLLTHTGPRGLDGHPLGGCGSGFGLVPDYTTLSRVRANI